MGLERDPVTHKGSFHAKDAPSPKDREAFERRQRHLRDHLTGIHPDDLDAMLGPFLMGYSYMRNLTGEEFDKSLDEYARLLLGFPAWAIDAALTKAVDGGTDPRYVPNAAELRWKARAEVAPYEKELSELTVILDAKIVDDPLPTVEERKAIVDKYWTEELRSSVVLAGADPIEEEEKKLAMKEEFVRVSKQQMERWQHHEGIDPGSVPHSPALLKTFERMRQDIRSSENKSGHESPSDRSASA